MPHQTTSVIDHAAHARLAADLASRLRGPVIDRTHPEYDRARRVWNGMIDRYPAVVARCTGTADVVDAVRLAGEHRPIVSIRGGGHQIAGSAVCDDGLVIDLSPMKGVHVDRVRRTARAQGGVTWGEFDRATQLFGLATNGGEVSGTGVAGFTLGGGMGLLMRSHGLACDTLRSVEIVTADGHVRTASRTEHPDLFWAVRGGGRGIGVVTSFEFDLRPLGPEVAVAQPVYAWDDAELVIRRFADLAREAPDTVTPQLILWTIPPHPAFPADLHDRKVLIAIALFAGPVEESGAALAPWRRLATPVFDMSGTAPYLAVQSSFDDVFPTGVRCYMKSHFMDALSDDAIATLVASCDRWPPSAPLIAIRTLSGAIARVSPDESAYAHRSATFNLSLDAAWTDAGMDGDIIGWVREAWDAQRPFATGGVYVNFSGFGEDEPESMHARVFGASEARLAEVRRQYDPSGVLSAAAYRP